MFFSLHDFCLQQLDHPINQALVCGKRWPKGSSKDLLLNFNLIHLFVVSGAHAIFFEKILKALKLNKATQLSCLGLYVLCCNFSSPINRCFIERLISLFLKSIHLHSPKLVTKVSSGFLCLPFSLYKGEFISLLLSLYFSFVVSSIDHQKAFEFKIITLSLPIYIWFLGLPPFSAIIVLLFATPLIGSVLMPLSFLSLFSDSIEWQSHKLWWFFLDVVRYIEVFFNFPKKQSSDFENWPLVLIHLTVIFFVTFGGLSIWKRHTYFTS